jgi:hypothetical protein
MTPELHEFISERLADALGSLSKLYGALDALEVALANQEIGAAEIWDAPAEEEGLGQDPQHDS